VRKPLRHPLSIEGEEVVKPREVEVVVVEVG